VGKSTSSAGVRLSADQNAASSAGSVRNCGNITTAGAHALRFTLSAFDYTTTGHTAGYFNNGLLSRGTSASTVTLALGAASTLGDAITVNLSADTSLGCINATVTPPSATATDEWHYTLEVSGTETH
jgi:hypothetical protein